MSEPTLKLQRNADELLRDLPMAEPDLEARAQAIAGKLGSKPAEGALSDDDLFRAPELMAEVGEPSLPVPPSAVRAGQKSNFAEMARKSLQKGEDDATALAKELMAAAKSRRPDAEMVERVKAAGRAGATASPLPTGDVERTSGVVTRAEPVPVAAAVPVAAPASSPSRGVSRGTVIGIFGSVVGIAACLALYFKTNEPASSPTSAALQAEKAADAVVAATPQAGRPAPTAAAKPNDGVVSPEALAPATEPQAPEGEKRGGGKAAAVAAAPAGAPGGSPKVAAAAPSAAAPKQEAVVLEDDPAPAQAPVAEKKAEPTPEPQLKPAEGNGGSLPISPSAGAVSTALGSVRSDAQACLAGQTEAVSASVTFGSDGHVLSVRASGPAAACIQAALSKAHVAPFAKDSFTAPITIRPP
ncbi:MAG TPA: hypothetical protein VHB79_24495 [Polyangiaceae bacterium]|nr:hypothetical protein [Polyangiaceae bacterium]